MRASINISLPKPLKDFVENQVSERGYSTASEYVRELLRREREQRVRMAVDQRLTEALATPAKPLTRKVWDEIRREGLKRATGKK